MAVKLPTIVYYRKRKETIAFGYTKEEQEIIKNTKFKRRENE